MSFIDQQQADRIAKWMREHPEEMKAFDKEYKILSKQFIAHELSFEEFVKKINELWDRVHG